MNIDLMPNNQERASELYTPVKSSEKALICLTCPLPTCKPEKCKRYSAEFKKLKGDKTEYNSIK